MSSTPSTGSRHLPAGRRAALLEFLGTTGQLTVAQLSERFDLSIDTIRRDLDLLDTRDNITCGVALLRSLTRSARTTDEVIGAYYQGLTSVRQNGYYPDTTRYVVQVRAHMKRLADR